MTDDRAAVLREAESAVRRKAIHDGEDFCTGIEFAADLIGQMADEAAQKNAGPNLTPGYINPPGSTSELLPPEILAAIDVPPYLSTACDTALRVEPADVPDAMGWARRLHARCRLNNKFTGAPCPCTCHDKEA
ncbi:hypothetical protein [Streptomyces platensis]|uniref:hypothetical protein n=1 Tax=Streptomyces platensis TaxID=58346 RepID=UPI00331EA344